MAWLSLSKSERFDWFLLCPVLFFFLLGALSKETVYSSVFSVAKRENSNKQVLSKRHVINNLLNSLARAVLGNIGSRSFLTERAQ